MMVMEAAAAAASVSCSICLEVVADSGDQSMAKLQCGHQFHLDCIGSAFNAKGAMQCPNCRKIEKGQWLYANGCRPYHEFSMDDAHDDDLYDLTYPETTSMWCPFGGFTRLAASFDEGEFPTTAYHDFLGQHAIFTEHATVMSSATHLCPYIAYVQPVHPSSSSSASGSVADGPTYNNNNNNNNNSNNQWNSSRLAFSEIPNSYPLPNMDVRYHTTVFPPSHNHVGGADQPSLPSVVPPRPVRNNADIPRSGAYVHPFLPGQRWKYPWRKMDGVNELDENGNVSNHLDLDAAKQTFGRKSQKWPNFSSVAARAPGSVGSSMIPPHPGSAARARERAQALQAYFQQPSSLLGVRTPIVSGSRRSNSQAQMGQAGSSSDHIRGGGIYYIPTSGSATRSGFQEAESSMPGPFHHNTWERDPPPLPPPAPRGRARVGVSPGWGWLWCHLSAAVWFREENVSRSLLVIS